MLPILYSDAQYVAISKPAGMLVHRSQIAADVTANFAMQVLRDQLKQRVYPIHRLDRPTSGVLLFALSSEAAAKMVQLFTNNLVQKHYLTIVRGYIDQYGTIDYPLSKENKGVLQEACTQYRCLAQVEVPIATNRYATARYSLVTASPLHGRMHQIRRHFKHIFHPVIGDTTYGDLYQNRFVAEHFQTFNQLMLLAHQLHFTHPYTQQNVQIIAPIASHMQQLMLDFGWGNVVFNCD